MACESASFGDRGSSDQVQYLLRVLRITLKGDELLATYENVREQ